MSKLILILIILLIIIGLIYCISKNNEGFSQKNHPSLEIKLHTEMLDEQANVNLSKSKINMNYAKDLSNFLKNTQINCSNNICAFFKYLINDFCKNYNASDKTIIDNHSLQNANNLFSDILTKYLNEQLKLLPDSDCPKNYFISETQVTEKTTPTQTGKAACFVNVPAPTLPPNNNNENNNNYDYDTERKNESFKLLNTFFHNFKIAKSKHNYDTKIKNLLPTEELLHSNNKNFLLIEYTIYHILNTLTNNNIFYDNLPCIYYDKISCSKDRCKYDNNNNICYSKENVALSCISKEKCNSLTSYGESYCNSHKGCVYKDKQCKLSDSPSIKLCDALEIDNDNTCINKNENDCDKDKCKYIKNDLFGRKFGSCLKKELPLYSKYLKSKNDCVEVENQVWVPLDNKPDTTDGVCVDIDESCNDIGGKYGKEICNARRDCIWQSAGYDNNIGYCKNIDVSNSQVDLIAQKIHNNEIHKLVRNVENESRYNKYLKNIKKIIK